MALSADLDRRVQAVRRFNRFYTRKIGVLGEGLLDSPFTLTQARILYELAHRNRPTASDLAEALGLDPGYLSRILRGFEKQGLLSRAASAEDARQRHLSLTAKGRKTFAGLDRVTRRQIAGLLEPLSEPDRGRLETAMRQIESMLDAHDGEAEAAADIVLRPHRPGDMGWVAHRHGALYAAEYGWDGTFEALVAEIVAGFVKNFDPARERCWIAERRGEILGSVFLVQETATIAKLRMLLVEPSARGLGLGRRLVEECLAFARDRGYRRVRLWTNSNLTAARKLYESFGFRLIKSEPHRSFGHDLVGETWELTL
ncbi:MAG TPA: bifunctional helix-turn-helix transcriptional regulator/GNAT family N-acetyltransferase [Hypericibacter adhaerens]|jgi:DNA-binding MarR family transcriptional regulator/predicted N-acetyltransferase YhbS|uniref:GNAT family N-acetyltransferase n=1 Tax=Hypericibacter adhaerens TaxID=2602016 RepID=A0A5J6MRS8_9PROT|nr:bifunctional helix-turn-helix transcriptional regulator/GNAT family N-acetyltransferase [Hypericibacter adhaerens]QEX20134.1 GNAT family N-acetyltransferase [Hypericibacter adhaerens]HWA46494.1 bifunctional helix-turn-helix transcriptional regulator/GNAT family N-acetyltransferase [Hypericibacter adhaerens]